MLPGEEKGYSAQDLVKIDFLWSDFVDQLSNDTKYVYDLVNIKEDTHL